METLYSKHHTWVRFLSDSEALVGVTQYLVNVKKNPSFINLCEEGDTVRAGGWLGDVEFFKGVTDILSPVSGTVAAVNNELLLQPQTLQNADTWIVRLSDVKRDGVLWSETDYTHYFTRGAR